MKKYLIIVIVVMVVIVVGVGTLYLSERKNRIRLETNQRNLYTDPVRQILPDSSKTYDQGVITLTKKELKYILDSTQKEFLKNMDIKIRQVESYTSAIISTVGKFEVIASDTTILRKTPDGKITPILGKHWKKEDAWWSVECIEIDTSRFVTVEDRNTMDQVVYKERKGIRFWKPTKFRQVIHFGNPNTNIKYNEYFEVQKSK